MTHVGDITALSGYDLPPVDVITGGSPCQDSSAEVYKVYRYTFPDGKVYVGVTKNTVQKRKDCGYQHNKPLTNAIREAGFKNVKIDILAKTKDRNAAFELEKEYIEQFRATEPEFGYNVSHGGKSTFLGLKHTREHREKMSRLYSGRTFSGETLERMKVAHAKERKPVASVDSGGNVIKQYPCLIAAATDVSGYPTNITRACESGKPYKGVFWRFLERDGDSG